MTRSARRSLRDLLRLRAVAAVLLVGFASLTWWWTIDDLHVWRQHSAPDRRGVTTTATVLGYSYDADGGDPGGWTTDHVRFTTAGRATVVATVGHHDPGSERFNRVMDVTYDPQHLNVVRATHYLDDADDPSNAVAGAMVAVLVTAAAAFATPFREAAIPALLDRRTRLVSPLRGIRVRAAVTVGGWLRDRSFR